MTAPAQVAGVGRQARWTRDNIIEKIREWVAIYGEPPRAADWNPSSAKWSGQSWRIARYEAGDWPSLNAAKRPFGGSLNEAIRAAGFEPNKPGPPGSRRKSAEPDIEDRMVMSPVARVALEDARREVRELVERVAVRDRQLARSREANERLRGEVESARRATAAARRERPAVVTKTKTKVERVRVPDGVAVRRLERALERASAQAADAEARAGVERKAARDAKRTLVRVSKEAEAARADAAEARAEARDAVRERNAVQDRLVAVERAPAPVPEVVVERVEVRSASDREVADARVAVRAAQKAAHDAEVRAARFEREYREVVALVTGEQRRLTAAELAELRKGGPSGPGVLMKAMKEVVEARNGRAAALPAALTKLASAAIRWREAL